MSDLNLDLPKSSPQPSPKKSGPPLLHVFTFIALLVLIGLQFTDSKSSPASKVIQVGVQEKALPFNENVLLRLEKAGAHGEAARTLSVALGAENLTSDRRSELLTRRGRLYALAGEHEKALADFFRAEEILGGEPNTELSREILESLRRMGRFDAASDELRSLNRRQQGQDDTQQDPVLARVDGEELKLGEFRNVVDLAVEQKLMALPRDGMGADDFKKAEEEIRKQLATPGERWKLLQEWVSSEVLFREALLWKLDQSPEFLDRMENFRRGVLGQMIVTQQIEKAQPREEDIQNELTANPETYGPSANLNQWTPVEREQAQIKAREAYLTTWRNERQQAFQQDLMERHKVEVFREVFEEGQP